MALAQKSWWRVPARGEEDEVEVGEVCLARCGGSDKAEREMDEDNEVDL